MLVNYTREKLNEKSHIDELLAKLNGNDLAIFDKFDQDLINIVNDQKYILKDMDRIRIASDFCYDFCQSLLFKSEPTEKLVSDYLVKAEEKCILQSEKNTKI
ncbi:MAG: hypothetical protein WCQ49_00500 [Candidatus Saccharibacteria bacterium]